MRFSTFLFLSIILSGTCFAQEADSHQVVSKPTSGLEKPYIVQLTEFRWKKSADTKMSSSDIVKALEEMKDTGDVEMIETIRLSALLGYENMMQICKRVSVTVGVMIAPGRGQTRQTQQQMVGTMVRITVEPANGKTLLKLSYEASRFEGEGTEDSPPDTKTFQVNSTLLLDDSKTALVGGTSAESTTFLAVSVK